MLWFTIKEYSLEKISIPQFDHKKKKIENTHLISWKKLKISINILK